MCKTTRVEIRVSRNAPGGARPAHAPRARAGEKLDALVNRDVRKPTRIKLRKRSVLLQANYNKATHILLLARKPMNNRTSPDTQWQFTINKNSPVRRIASTTRFACQSVVVLSHETIARHDSIPWNSFNGARNDIIPRLHGRIASRREAPVASRLANVTALWRSDIAQLRSE